ncbi:MAG: 3-hydroxyacyl-CoA dehydrogenase NAD-binding domain-containing protein [Chloroflexota bacterium]
MPGVVGIVGAGTMGAGIAQLALEAGHEVVLHDVDVAAIERGRARIRSGLERRARRLDLDHESADAWVDGRLGRLRAGPAIDDVAAAEPLLIVEVALEDLETKRAIFRTLDAAVGAGTVLATNTSALSVAEIAAATGRPERVLGLHFFNPAPVMPLVEVVVPLGTDPAVAERATALVTAWGKVAVRCTDTPGFIVNRVNRPFTLEALAILGAGRASVTSIDAAIRGSGLPMGPFELMDLVGLDINLAAAMGIYDGSRAAGDPLAGRFMPSAIQERLVAAGQLGRKTGSGFYDYEPDGRPSGPAADFAHPGVAGDGLPAKAIVERIMLAIVNEAYRALGDEVATAADIDLALRLGAGHPIGPIERVEGLGGRGAVLAGLRRHAGDGPRFEPASSLLQQV